LRRSLLVQQQDAHHSLVQQQGAQAAHLSPLTALLDAVPDFGDLDVMASVSVAIGDDVTERLDWAKPQLALYIGGMGAKGRNFYHNVATKYGFGEAADRIQELYLSGKKVEAIAAVPDELVRSVSLIGPRSYVQERIAAFAEAGVTTLLAAPVATDGAEYVGYVEELQQLLP
jgi:alkanesulfonate monooxygenase SsuD/methylene tetrahydromethanopterin reductase-like flavin-dependent oxidoreductase (luciferase family)